MDSGLAAPLRAAGWRPAAQCDLPAAVDIDPDQLVRRPGHDARAAVDRRRAAARDADADGLAHIDGDPAVRAVLTALRRVARSGAQAARLHRRRDADGV